MNRHNFSLKKIITLSLRTRAYLIVAILFLAFCSLWMTVNYQSTNVHELTKYIDNLHNIKEDYNKIQIAEKDFLFYFKDDKDFIEQSNNKYLKTFNRIHEDIVKDKIISLENSKYTKEIDPEKKRFLSLKNTFVSYKNYFETIITKITEKGWGDYGIIASMTISIETALDQKMPPELRKKIFEMRGLERDYLVLGDTKYHNWFLEKSKDIKGYISINRELGEKEQDSIFNDKTSEYESVDDNYEDTNYPVLIRNYMKGFSKIVTIDKEIGKTNNEGLRGKISSAHIIIQNNLDVLEKNANEIRIDKIRRYKTSRTILIFVFFILVAIVLIFFIQVSLKPLNSLTIFLSNLSKGVVPDYKLKSKSRDLEIIDLEKSINKVAESIRTASAFSTSIANNNFNIEYKPLSDRDMLGNQLINLRNNLLSSREAENERKIEEEKRNWTTLGVSKFNDILRTNNSSDINELSYSVISNLVPYLSANQGGLFVFNDDNQDDMHLQLVASYAYNRRKFLDKTILIGEGVIGACALEKKTIYIKNVPEDYISITSGLGKATPKTILIVPLLKEDELMGIFEIASFNLFEQYQIDFVEKVAQTVASTLSAAKISHRTKLLLEDSQHKSEAMLAQEEEMRQNLEELEATREEANRKEAEASAFVSAVNHTSIRLDIDLNGNIIYANPRFLDLTGYASQELKGKHYSFIIEEAKDEFFQKRWEQLLKSGKHFDREIKYKAKNGLIWVLGTFTAVHTESGDVKQILHLSQNISAKKKQQEAITLHTEEQKKIEAELRSKMDELLKIKTDLEKKTVIQEQVQDNLAQKTYLLDALLENIPDIVYFKDLKSKLLLVSNSSAKAFGFEEPKEMIGKTDFDFFTEEHAMPAYNDEQRIIRTGKPLINIEEKETWKDGRVSWASTSKLPLRDLRGNIVGTFGISRDITNQKKLELELKEQNEQLLAVEEELRQNLEELQTIQEDLKRKNEEYAVIHEELRKHTYLLDALMDNIPDALYFKDKDSRFIRISKAQAKRFGFNDPMKVIGKSDFNFFDEEHAQSAFAQENKIMRTGQPLVEHIDKIKRKDGIVNWVSTTKMPLYDLDGEIVGTFGISRDITEQKKLEIELKEQNEVFRATDEELRQNLEELRSIQEDLQRRAEHEQKLRAQMEKQSSLLDALMNNLPDSVYFKDRESAFIRNSMSQVKRFGYERYEDLVGKTDFDVFSEEHAQKAFNDEMRIMRTAKPILNVIEKRKLPDGSITWASTTKLPLYNSEGKIIGTFGLSRDITKEHLLAEELKEQNQMLEETQENLHKKLMQYEQLQEKYKTQNDQFQQTVKILTSEKIMFDVLMANMPGKVMFKDTNNICLRINKSMADILNIGNPTDALGKTDYDFYNREIASLYITEDNTIMKSGKPFINTETHTLYDDGSTTWQLTSKVPFFDEDKNVLGILIHIRDITLRKKNESKLDYHKQVANVLSQNYKGCKFIINENGTLEECISFDMKNNPIECKEIENKDIEDVIPGLKLKLPNKPSKHLRFRAAWKLNGRMVNFENYVYKNAVKGEGWFCLAIEE